MAPFVLVMYRISFLKEKWLILTKVPVTISYEGLVAIFGSALLDTLLQLSCVLQ
jgi:hypothetical protein